MNEPIANPSATASFKRQIRLVDLVLFNIAAVLGPQLIPAFAHVGPIAIPLHLSAALFFFVPCVLVVAHLSRLFPVEGGFYVWTREAFGERHAVLCGWSWWLSTILYLPTLLLIAVGMAWQSAHLVNERAEVAASFVFLWLIALINMRSLRLSKWVSNVGGGLIYLGSAIVFLSGIAVWLLHGSATSFHLHNVLNVTSVSLWAQIAFAYTGLELGSLMGGEILHPGRTIPRAAFISASAVGLAFAVASCSLMLVLKPDQIDPISGLAQVASVAGTQLGFPALGAVTSVLLILGILGKFSTWNAGGARMPLSLSLDGHFPPVFRSLHPRWNTPWAAILAQAVLCSAFLVFTQSGATLRYGWQLLMDLTILVTFFPYIYIFLSGWRFGKRISGLAGLLVTLLAMAFALVPPEGEVSVLSFESKALGGSTFLVLLGLLLYRPRRRTP